MRIRLSAPTSRDFLCKALPLCRHGGRQPFLLPQSTAGHRGQSGRGRPEDHVTAPERETGLVVRGVGESNMAARTRKIRHDEETRAKIRTSQLINRLEGHVFGNVEMTATQVTAGLGLLRKTLPDISSVEHSGEIATKRSAEMSDDELAAIAAGRGETTVAAPLDPAKLN